MDARTPVLSTPSRAGYSSRSVSEQVDEVVKTLSPRPWTASSSTDTLCRAFLRAMSDMPLVM